MSQNFCSQCHDDRQFDVIRYDSELPCAEWKSVRDFNLASDQALEDCLLPPLDEEYAELFPMKTVQADLELLIEEQCASILDRNNCKMAGLGFLISLLQFKSLDQVKQHMHYNAVWPKNVALARLLVSFIIN